MVPLRSLRKKAAPSTCCLPPAASGPVLTVRNPTLSGSGACENARRDGSTPSAAPPISNVRREIASLPFLPGILELHEVFRLYRRAEMQWDDEPIASYRQAHAILAREPPARPCWREGRGATAAQLQCCVFGDQPGRR